MRLHPTTGVGAMGIGTNISIDGVIPAPLVGVGALYPRWIQPAGNVLLFFNNDLGTLQQIDLDTSVVTTVAPGGALVLAAGNGLYVASLSTGALQGVRSNISGWSRLSLAGLGDMDGSGAFAVIQAFASDRGVSLYASSGALITTIDIPIAPGAVIRCNTGLCAFSGSASAWQLRSLTDGSVVPFADREQGVIETVPLEMADGRIVVVERTGNDTLTLRVATGNLGYVISSTIVYNPDAMEISPGVVRVGYSATAGEGPTALRMVDLTLASGAQTLWTTASGSLVSSAGPTLTVTSLPATLPEQGLGALFAGHHPFTEQQSGMLTLAFGKPWVDLVSRILGQPVNLATQVTGVLPVGSGGTGGTGGTSVVNGANIIGIIPPGPLMNIPNVGFWTLLTAGAPLNLSLLSQQAGYWSPLMSGPDAATSTMVLTAEGDAIMTWTQTSDGPMLPAFIEDSSGGAIAVWEPTPDEGAFT